MISALFWLSVILVSAMTAYVATLPLRNRMRSIESLLDMVLKIKDGELKVENTKED